MAQSGHGGLFPSLARPGGNITGLVVRPLELAAKQLDLLMQALPGRNRLAVLYDALTADQFNTADRAAKSLNDVRYGHLADIDWS